HSTLKLFATVIGAPENAGTFAARKWRRAHLPAAVPANAPSTSCASETLPFGVNVSWTLPLPGAPPWPHWPARVAALFRAVLAAFLSNSAAATLGLLLGAVARGGGFLAAT